MGSSRNNHFPVHQWRTACMSSHMVSPKQSSRNSGNKFRLTSPLTLPNFVALRREVCEISVMEKFCSSEKWAKVHPRLSDLLPIYSFYKYFVVSLAIDCFISVISLILYRKHHFCTYSIQYCIPPISPKIWKCFPRIRSMSSAVQWARSLG